MSGRLPAGEAVRQPDPAPDATRRTVGGTRPHPMRGRHVPYARPATPPEAGNGRAATRQFVVSGRVVFCHG
ncbi:hypothetical protein ACWD01_00875 [Streptomyces sp. NPDC002835]